MSAPNGKPLFPTSWQAGGKQGGAGTWDRSDDKPTALPPMVRAVAAWHIDAARALLLGFALGTDRPEWGAVDATDWLDAAADALAAGFGTGGDA